MEKFIAIDFETAHGKRWSACAIGIVVVQYGVIIEKYWSLIQPPNNEYSPYNINIHKITPEMTRNAPSFDILFPTIKRYLSDNCLVCHGVDFDLNVLQQTMDYYGIENDLNYTQYCTMQLSGGKGLTECCDELDIMLDHHHDALADAEACAKLFLILNNESRYSNATEIERRNDNINISLNFYSSGQKIKGDVLNKDLSLVKNPDNPFYNKKVVISGTYEFWPDRTVLANLLKQLGADIDSGITGKTNFLICGKDAGPKKIEKMKKNIDNGSEAVIFDETQLRQILNEIDSLDIDHIN